MEHPRVDLDFILSQIRASKNCLHCEVFEDLVCIIKVGTGSIARRFYTLDNQSSDVCFAQSIHLAQVFNFHDQLSLWLETNKSWKEGEYFVPKENN